MDAPQNQKILDQIKTLKWSSPVDWVKEDPKLFCQFCELPPLDRRKAFPYLSDKFSLKLKPNANIGALFADLSSDQWLELFDALGIVSLKTDHKWALIQYRSTFKELPAHLTSTTSRLALDPLLSDEQIIEFILTRSAPLVRSLTLLFSSKMEIARKWSILSQMAQLVPSELASAKTLATVNQIQVTFQKHQQTPPDEIRRVLDSLLSQHRKDTEAFTSKYLPILLQDVLDISILYLRVKKGGLKPKKDKSNRPQLFQEIYEGRELFKRMVIFFGIQWEELDEFPFLEKVLRLQHLIQELFGQSDWPNLSSKNEVSP
ncbi:MAG: hypothetical protein ABIQ95_03750 [Bdellovibrionia bacterium]